MRRIYLIKLTITNDGIKLEPYSLKLHISITLLMTGFLALSTIGMVLILERLT